MGSDYFDNDYPHIPRWVSCSSFMEGNYRRRTKQPLLMWSHVVVHLEGSVYRRSDIPFLKLPHLVELGQGIIGEEKGFSPSWCLMWYL